MLGKPTTNPSLPYVGPLGSNLSPGKFIRILGTVSSVGKHFFTNLQCGSSHFDDIALHISVRLNEGRIIAKYQQFGTWNDEHIYENTEISRGKPFEILVICELTVFKIGVNGHHLCEFPHKVPYVRISHIRVEGDVSVAQISVEAQPTVTSPVMYSQGTNSDPPPYPGAAAPSTFPQPTTTGPPYPLNSGPQQPVHPNAYPYPPNQNVIVTGPYNPLLPQQQQSLQPQPLPPGAINAMPRPYQSPSWTRWGSRSAHSKKVVFIILGVSVAIFVLFLIVFFTIFFKAHKHINDTQRQMDEWRRENFPNHNF